MPKSIWEKAGDEARAVNDKADAVADNAIDVVKEKTGRFTWAAILGTVVAIILVIVLVKIL